MFKGLTTVLTVAVCACGSDDLSSSKTASSEPKTPDASWKPVAPDQLFEGKSNEEWAVEWRRWAFAQSDCQEDTQYDADGSLCALHQQADSPVFFFDRGPRGTIRTKCHVPKDKAIAIPIALISNDNGGVEMPVSEQELRDSVVEIQRSVRDLVLEVDGHEVDNLAEMYIGPTRLSYHVPPAPNWYSCRKMDGVDDEIIEPCYLIGYLAILPPLRKAGQHTVRYGYTLTYSGTNVVSDVTSTFQLD